MAGSTTNLGLTKPTYAESQDVTILNGNMDLIDAEAGKVRGNFSGAYDASGSYAVGEYCIYNGVLYRCTTAISGGEAWNSNHWTQVNVGDELGTLSEQIATLQNDINQKMTNSFAGTGVSLECSGSISSRQYDVLLIGGGDVILVTLHTQNYNSVSLKTGTAITTTISGNTISVSGLDFSRYYIFDPLQIVRSITAS